MAPKLKQKGKKKFKKIRRNEDFCLDGEKRDAEEQRLPSSVLPSLEGLCYQPGLVTTARLCLLRW